ncbi:hypothetical protein LPJ53_000389 [Coemansia erecta]|uniref:CCHC-type domain-containing protein n=1 Tax=Coemansia erecta TaxID=147472 RepID=A0A9W7Y233_9FUNG|nr:hypothetical protein LPJ53_000389 [Coemansia erecta]
MPEATEPAASEALYGNASDSDNIDSDTEERVLSFLYHQSADQAAAAAAMAAAAPARQQPATGKHSDDEDAEDSKYNIGTKPRAADTASADSNGASRISVAVVRPFRSSTLTEDEEDDASDADMGAGKQARANGNTVSYNASDDEAVGEYLDSVATSGQLTPTRPLSSTLSTTPFVESVMEQQSIRIDSISLKTPVHEVQIRHAGESEYDYLDDMEIMGHNRYFMEEKEIICRKCKGSGHIAKDCDVQVCMLCGEKGHLAKECKHSGNVCHRCHMRGHMSAECPQRSSSKRGRNQPKTCHRCPDMNHHADECPTIWRRYVYGRNLPPVYEDVTAWCYNCAREGHFGDDCPDDQPSWSLSFYGHTAYHLRNCPGKVPEDTSIRSRRGNHSRRDNHHYPRSSTTPISQRLGPRNSFSDSRVRKDWRNRSHNGPRSEHRGDRSHNRRNDSFTPSKPYRPSNRNGNSSSRKSGHGNDNTSRSPWKNKSK